MFFTKNTLQNEKNYYYPDFSVTDRISPLKSAKNKATQGNNFTVTLLPKKEHFATSKPLLTAEGNKVTEVTVKKHNINILSDEWFLDFFEECAGIFEHDAKQIKSEAEMNAFDECIYKWLDTQKLEANNDNIGKAIEYLMNCGIRNPFYKDN